MNNIDDVVEEYQITFSATRIGASTRGAPNRLELEGDILTWDDAVELFEAFLRGLTFAPPRDMVNILRKKSD